MKKVVLKLNEVNKTISFMESCTGGYLASEFTNNLNASKSLLYSCTTYSDEYKIKMGVNESILKKYTAYSRETAVEMAKVISEYSNSDYGVSTTGNLTEVNDIVYICIYDKKNNQYYNMSFSSDDSDRKNNKKVICDLISKKLYSIV